MEVTIVLMTISLVINVFVLITLIGVARSLVKLYDWISGEDEDVPAKPDPKMQAFRLWAKQMGYDESSLQAMNSMMNMKSAPNWDGVSERKQQQNTLSKWVQDS